MESFKIKISPEADGMRMSEYLKRILGFSSTLITKVKYGGVILNESTVTMRATVKAGDELQIIFPSEESENVLPIPTPLDILYEDEYLIAVNKPKNMPVHPSRGNHLVTLANAIAAYLDKPFVFRAVNRLDRDTCGIVIIAKDQYCAARLSASMKSGNFEKYYTALLSSVPKEKSGIINAPIEREEEGSIKRIVRDDGKEALTEYKVTKIFDDGRALCEIRLHTGRTHQIRVHFAHIGSPLYNDFLYGTIVDPNATYSLCCSKIVFPHPITAKRMTVALSENLEELLLR